MQRPQSRQIGQTDHTLGQYVHQPEGAAALHDHLQKSKPLPWVELEPYRRGKKSAQPVDRDQRWNVIIRRRPELDE